MVRLGRHKWDHAAERRVAAAEFSDGCARNFRVCIHCGMRKITVIPPHGFPWHEWVTRDKRQFRAEATPACVRVFADDAA